jgi:FG-GAP repeat
VGGLSYAGASYVVFGRNTAQTGDFPELFEMSTLFPDSGGDGSAGFVVVPINDYDFLGESVSTAGDLNGDGIADIIISATAYDSGVSYVIFGKNTAQTGNFPALFEVSSLWPAGGGDGSTGAVLSGSAGAVSAAGDVNADGRDDVIIGAPGSSPGGRNAAGVSYVVFGRAASQIVDATRPPIEVAAEPPD